MSPIAIIEASFLAFTARAVFTDSDTIGAIAPARMNSTERMTVVSMIVMPRWLPTVVLLSTKRCASVHCAWRRVTRPPGCPSRPVSDPARDADG